MGWDGMDGWEEGGREEQQESRLAEVVPTFTPPSEWKSCDGVEMEWSSRVTSADKPNACIVRATQIESVLLPWTRISL